MILNVTQLKKSYQRGDERVDAVDGISFSAAPGEFICVVGPSGSGKSSLLHLVGGLDRPTSGEVWIGDRSIAALSDRELSRFRRDRLGFVFQFFNLLPNLTAEENVALPLLLGSTPASIAREKSRDLLAQMGLEHRRTHRPAHLSGGEMQRVAIARALVNDPLLILADEPTGNLDSKTGIAVLEILQKIVSKGKQTLIMVTHDAKAASCGSRTISIRDGKIESDR